jgi:hypothetical protein
MNTFLRRQNVTRAWKYFWAHQIELLGDIGSFGGSVNLDVR